MRFAYFRLDGKDQMGIGVEGGILPLSVLLKDGSDGAEGYWLPDSGHLRELELGLASVPSHLKDSTVPEEDVEFLPCVPFPGKIICVGKNYREHAAETNSSVPETPILFSKFGNSIAANREKIPVPFEGAHLDYEGELGIMIGSVASHVSEDEALDHVFGYFTADDVSERSLQFITSQWLMGKTLDKFCPIGPYLVTSGEVADPDSLHLETRVNGELCQNANTSEMIFSCRQIISYASKYLPLLPGDIILTGTPSGVILGKPKESQVWLKSGDEVTISIEKVGTLTNRFV